MIIVAIQKGNQVYVYKERNSLLFIKSGQLQGYTATTVSVKQGNTIYTYNDHGSLISMHS